MIFSFLIAVISTIEMAFPFLDDPYYYFTSVLNILRTGSLSPSLSSWHWVVSFLPYYPILHTWTASVILIIGVIPSIESIRFATISMAFLNSLVPLLTYVFCKNISKNINISLLAATIMSSGFAFYQYHEQYMAVIIYLILFNVVFINKTPFRFLTVISLISFSMVHRASVFILLLFLVFNLILILLPYFKKSLLRENINSLILGIVLMLSSLVIIYIGFLKGLISESAYFFTDPFTAHLLDKLGGSNIFATQSLFIRIYGFFSYSKYFIFILSILGILFITLQKDEVKNNYSSYILYYSSFLLLTIGGGLIKIQSIGRFILFFYLFIVLFSSTFIYELIPKTNSKKVVLIVVLGALISSNALYNVPPQFFDARYSHLPPMDEYHSSGRWVYVNDDAKNYVVGPGLRHIADYFGEKPYSKTTVIDYHIKNGSVNLKVGMSSKSYTLILSTKFYGPYLQDVYIPLESDIKDHLTNHNLVYNSGEVLIMKSSYLLGLSILDT